MRHIILTLTISLVLMSCSQKKTNNALPETFLGRWYDSPTTDNMEGRGIEIINLSTGEISCNSFSELYSMEKGTTTLKYLDSSLALFDGSHLILNHNLNNTEKLTADSNINKLLNQAGIIYYRDGSNEYHEKAQEIYTEIRVAARNYGQQIVDESGEITSDESTQQESNNVFVGTWVSQNGEEKLIIKKITGDTYDVKCVYAAGIATGTVDPTGSATIINGKLVMDDGWGKIVFTNGKLYSAGTYYNKK